MSLTAPPCKQAPTIYSRQATVTIEKKRKVTLACVVESKDCGTGSPLRFYWRRPNGKIAFKRRTKTEVVSSGGINNNVRTIMTLTITRTSKRKSGAYKCFISGVGIKASSTVQLTVE